MVKNSSIRGALVKIDAEDKPLVMDYSRMVYSDIATFPTIIDHGWKLSIELLPFMIFQSFFSAKRME